MHKGKIANCIFSCFFVCLGKETEWEHFKMYLCEFKYFILTGSRCSMVLIPLFFLSGWRAQPAKVYLHCFSFAISNLKLLGPREWREMCSPLFRENVITAFSQSLGHNCITVWNACFPPVTFSTNIITQLSFNTRLAGFNFRLTHFWWDISVHVLDYVGNCVQMLRWNNFGQHAIQQYCQSQSFSTRGKRNKCLIQ